VTGIEVPCDEKRHAEEGWKEVAEHWLRWHELIEAQDPELRIRLEDMEHFWPEMMKKLGRPHKQFPADVAPIGHDPRRLIRTPEITWEMLGPIAEEVKDKARSYGYVIES
jgi:hypothetical protein